MSSRPDLIPLKKGRGASVKAGRFNTLCAGWIEKWRANSRSTWLLGIVDQLICGVTSFLTGSLIAHGSSRSEFGLFSLGTTVILLLIDVQAGLVTTPQSIHTHGLDPVRTRSFSGSTLVHQIGIAATLSVILLFTVTWLPGDPSEPGLFGVMTMIAVFASFILLREYLRRFFYTTGRLVSVILFDGAIAVAQITAIYILSFNAMSSACLAHASIGAVSALCSVPVLVVLRREFRVSKDWVWPDFVKNFQVGRWTVVNNLSWTFGATAYPWLLAMSHGARTTALWAACMSIIGIMNIVLAGILNVLTTNMAQVFAGRTRKHFRSYAFRSCRNYVGIACLLSIVVAALGERLMVWVYGNAYAEAYPIVVILAINAVFGALIGGAGRGLMVAGGARADFLINAATLALALTAGWWASFSHGAFGAALSLTFANAAGGALRLYAFHRVSNQP